MDVLINNILHAIQLILFIILLYKFSSMFYYWEKRGIPHIKPLPPFGNFLDVIRGRYTMGHLLGKIYRDTNEPYLGIFLLTKPFLLLKDVDLIKSVLVKDFNYFCDRNMLADEQLDPISGNSLFLMKNPQWKLLRTKISPTFTASKLRGMSMLIMEVADELNIYLSKKTKEPIEIKELCAKYATDVIMSCAFGIRANCFESEDSKFREIGRKFFGFNLKRAICQMSYLVAPWLAKTLKLQFLDSDVSNFLSAVFWNAIHRREATKQKRNDLIDMMLEIRDSSSPNDELTFEGDRILAQAFVYFGAGFETSSTTMAFALYEICLNPEIQNKLRQDTNSGLSKYEGQFSYDAIHDMKYLHMVICETLRKYPSLSFLDRKCTKDYRIGGGDVVIEKGTGIIIPLIGLHYDPNFFPEPERFDPERFSDERKPMLQSLSYLPFGEGPRGCIGKRFGLFSVKLGLAYIISKFRLETCEDTPANVEFDSKYFLLTPNHGLFVKFSDISSTNQIINNNGKTDLINKV